jgi:lysine/ornithine N-monooxygenase
MRTSEGLQLAMRLIGQNKNATMIALEAIDLLEMRDNGYQLKDEDKFILGLVYSEFFATSNSDEAYIQASEKRDQYLATLGLQYKDIYNETERLYGRTNRI